MMKKQSKYILSVYIGFIFQLLTVIFSMLVCEKFSYLRLLSFENLKSQIDSFCVIALVFIGINTVIEWFWISEDKGGTVLISFYMLTVLCENIIYGTLLGGLDLMIKILNLPNVIQYAFWVTVTIFIGITIWAFFSNRKEYDHPVLSYCYAGIVIAGIFNTFWGWTWFDIVIDIISIIIVSFFIYFDTIKIKQHAKKVATFSKKVRFLNVLEDASSIYLDFLVIWINITDLMLDSEE